MIFRKTLKDDINSIMNIIILAQNSLKEQNIDQWQNGYPNIDSILSDVGLNQSYLLEDEKDIVATAMLSFDKEPTYDNINGEWLTNSAYAVIHRLAVDSTKTRNGYAKTILSHLEQLCLQNNVHSIKIDTHEDNKNMQLFLEKNNFQYCGEIFLLDGSKRIAFEKLIYNQKISNNANVEKNDN